MSGTEGRERRYIIPRNVYHEATQAAVEEEEVDAVPGVADAQAALAGDEGEADAEFEEEGFEVADQCGFQIVLGEIVAEVEKFEDEGVFEGGGGGEGVSGAGWGGTGYAATMRELAPLVGEGGDLTVELADGPALLKCFGGVEIARGGVFDGEEADVMRPGEGEGRLCRHRLHNRGGVCGG